MESWVETNNLSFWNLKKGFLTWMECGITKHGTQYCAQSDFPCCILIILIARASTHATCKLAGKPSALTLSVNCHQSPMFRYRTNSEQICNFPRLCPLTVYTTQFSNWIVDILCFPYACYIVRCFNNCNNNIFGMTSW